MDPENTPIADAPEVQAEDEAPKTFLLTTVIRDRFEKPVWRKMPKISPNCEMLIKPLPQEEITRVATKLKVCALCGGRNFLMNMSGERYLCPQCKGRGDKSWTSIEVRAEFAKRIIHGWRNMQAINPETMEPEEVPYSEEMRLTIAHTAVLDLAWEEASELVSVTKQEQSKSTS